MQLLIQSGTFYTNKGVNMNQIEKINYLINEYKNKHYTTDSFCDQFVSTLYYEKDDSISSELFVVLDEYASIFSRFSPFDEDVKSGILFDEERIKAEFNKMLTVISTVK